MKNIHEKAKKIVLQGVHSKSQTKIIPKTLKKNSNHKSLSPMSGSQKDFRRPIKTEREKKPLYTKKNSSVQKNEFGSQVNRIYFNRKSLYQNHINKIIYIQRWWRTVNCVIIIQKSFRGFLTRRNYKKRKTLNKGKSASDIKKKILSFSDFHTIDYEKTIENEVYVRKTLSPKNHFSKSNSKIYYPVAYENKKYVFKRKEIIKQNFIAWKDKCEIEMAFIKLNKLIKIAKKFKKIVSKKDNPRFPFLKKKYLYLLYNRLKRNYEIEKVPKMFFYGLNDSTDERHHLANLNENNKIINFKINIQNFNSNFMYKSHKTKKKEGEGAAPYKNSKPIQLKKIKQSKPKPQNQIIEKTIPLSKLIMNQIRHNNSM